MEIPEKNQMDVDKPDGAIETVDSSTTIPKTQILSDIHKSKESDLPWYVNYYELLMATYEQHKLTVLLYTPPPRFST